MEGGVGEVITHKSFKLQRQIDSVTQGSRSKDESGRGFGKGVGTELGYVQGFGVFRCSGFSNMLSSSGSFITKLINMFHVFVFCSRK